MNNKKSVILGILIIIVVCLITTGCMFYNLLDKQGFKQHFGALGYTISETEEAKYESKSYVVASKSDVPFKIEHYEFEKEVDAKKIYKKFKDTIADYITSDTQNLETTGAVFAKIVAKGEKDYIIISRVKNTIIFIDATAEYQNEIDKLLTDIKY